MILLTPIRLGFSKLSSAISYKSLYITHANDSDKGKSSENLKLIMEMNICLNQSM